VLTEPYQAVRVVDLKFFFHRNWTFVFVLVFPVIVEVCCTAGPEGTIHGSGWTIDPVWEVSEVVSGPLLLTIESSVAIPALQATVG